MLRIAKVAAVLVCGMVFMGKSAMGASGLQAGDLRCEYKANPLGIDTPSPRLSWTVASSQRRQRQTAYQVLVAESPEVLKADRGTVWDSGRVQSDQTVCVVYAGEPLKSLGVYYWKVRLWDRDGTPGPWSAPAVWQMGLLDPQHEWQAQWIGMKDRPVNLYQQQDSAAEQVVKACRWVWLPNEGDPTQAVPAGTRYFRKTFVLDSVASIEQARLYLAADNNAQVFVNGQPLTGAVGFPQAAAFDVKDALQAGPNVFAIAVRNEGDRANPAGLLGVAVMTYADGKTQAVRFDESSKCAPQAADGWQTVAFDDTGWETVVAFANNGDQPWGEVRLSSLTLRAPVYLRGTFETTKSVRRATALVSAMGLATVSINGQSIGEDYFVPGWTDYRRRIYYVQYDVTDRMRRGENVIAGMVADGWFAGYVGYGRQRDHYGRDVRLAVQLHVEYADGSRQMVVSDANWKVSTGPTLDADFLMGQTYDARRELTGWDRPGYDDSAWQPVVTGTPFSPQIQAYPGVTVKVFKEFSPVRITEPAKGVYVFDMGTNLAGVARLKVRGKPGDTVVLRFAERLNPDGTIYTTNLRSARATDTYVCKGQGLEIWQPRFTFHGFQYVEVTGYPGVPGKDAITAVELTSSTPVVGSFACSDPMLNQLYHNICQTQRANFIDVPTDCPQRDERLGWTGDAQVYIAAACYNTDVQAFFTKWLTDLADAQRDDGQFPKFAPIPPKMAGDDGGPGWADAGVICPWTIYQVYGDRRLLERHYEGMKRFIAFCKKRSTDELLPPRQFHCFGDWLNINDNTPNEVIYMSYFAYSTYLTARAAEALDKTDEARQYDALCEQIKAAFNKAYVDDDGKISGDSQTAYVLALAHDILEGRRKQQAAEHLIRKIRDNNWHLSTGFLGTKDLMHVLSKIGRYDVAYRLLHNETFPSWGFAIKHGATSIWERWNGWTPEHGFADPGMNSFAHYAYGAVGQWMFENIGGIRTDEPGFGHIVLSPRLDETLTWADVRYTSIRGPIVSRWEKADGVLEWEVQIPANTTATVAVPTSDAASVRESNRPLSQAEGIEVVGFQDGAVVLHVGSGTFRFRSVLP
jgi:alpha-L-rhamnosidase